MKPLSLAQAAILFSISGYTAFAYQIIGFKLLSASGLSSALAVAISLTAFVTISGLGALLSRRCFSSAHKADIAIGAYALFLFGWISASGVLSVSTTLSELPAWLRLLGYLVLLTPLSFISGALIPLHERTARLKMQREGARPFNYAYFMFHVAGGVSLILLDKVFIAAFGWDRVGIVFGVISMANGAWGWLHARDAQLMNASRTASWPVLTPHKLRALTLFGVSIGTGYVGLLTYKAFDYLAAPTVLNYSVVTAFILVALGLSASISQLTQIRFRTMVGLAGLGCLLFFFSVRLCGVFTSSYFLDSLGYNLAFYMCAAALAVPAFILIGLSVPVSVKTGMDSRIVLFLTAMGNAIGYWAAVTTASLNSSAYIVMGIGITYAALGPRKIAVPTIILMAGFIFQGHHSATIRMAAWAAKQAQYGFSSDPQKQWNTLGWSNDIVRLSKPADPNARHDKLILNISGYQSLVLSGQSPIYEFTSGFIPSVFAPRNDKALVLGAGTGTSAGVVSSLFKKTEIVDIGPDTDSLLRYFGHYNGNVLGKAEVIKDDGLSFLSKTNEKYDLIFSTVSGAGYSFSSMLYTEEFFRKAASKLGDGGVFAIWMDPLFDASKGIPSVLKAFQDVFPSYRAFSVGELTPWVYDGSGYIKDPDYFLLVGTVSSDGGLTSRKSVQALFPELPDLFKLRMASSIQDPPGFNPFTDTDLVVDRIKKYLWHREIYPCRNRIDKFEPNRMNTLAAAYSYHSDFQKYWGYQHPKEAQDKIDLALFRMEECVN